MADLKLSGKIKKVTEEIKVVNNDGNHYADGILIVNIDDLARDDFLKMKRAEKLGHPISLYVFLHQPELQAEHDIDELENTYQGAENPRGHQLPIHQDSYGNDSGDQGNTWAEAQELDGFKIGERVLVTSGPYYAERGVIQDIVGGKLSVMNEDGIGEPSLVYPKEVAYPEDAAAEAKQ